LECAPRSGSALCGAVLQFGRNAHKESEFFVWSIAKPADQDLGQVIDASDIRTKRRNASRWAERLVLISGIVLLTIYCAARIESILNSRSALRAFENLSSPAVSSEPDRGEGLTTLEADFTLRDDQRVRPKAPSFAEQSGVPLAVLKIPRIRLEVPMFNGTDDLTLNHGVGRIAGTARLGEGGNIGIAGHRDSFFRGLKDVSIGDAIELRTPTGIEMYTVVKINIVSPNDVDVLRRRSIPSLTLVTCYPFYYVGSAPQRYIVTASRIEKKNSESKSISSGLVSQISSPIRRGR